MNKVSKTVQPRFTAPRTEDSLLQSSRPHSSP